MSSGLRPYRANVELVPPGAGGGWTAAIRNVAGKVIVAGPLGEVIGLLEVWNSKFARIEVGLGDNGYTQPVISEPHGGGSVVVPYAINEETGELFIGVLDHARRLVHGVTSVPELPRGFAHTAFDESAWATASREFGEEAGGVRDRSRRMTRLPGQPTNMNTTYFRTDLAKDEGVVFFGLQFRWNEITVRNGEGRLATHLVEGIARGAEKIDPAGLRFIPFADAVRSADGFTRAGVAALLGSLTTAGEVHLIAAPLAPGDTRLRAHFHSPHGV